MITVIIVDMGAKWIVKVMKGGGEYMTEKRFTLEMQYWKGNPQGRKLFDNVTGQDGMSVEELCNIASALHCKCEELESVLEVYEDSLNKLEDENTELKKEKEELLYQIGEAGKNNKTCRECECFISEHNICYMWDMEVEADDVVVACDQRKVKNTNEMMSDD